MSSDLLAELEAYGATLADQVDQPIRPVDRSLTAGPGVVGDDGAATGLEPDPGVTVPLTMEARRSNRGLWLAAAALLLVVAGFGLGRLWPAGDGSIDSTGSPDDRTEAELDGTDEDGLPPDEGETAPVPPPDRPSTITAADGAVLALADNPDTVADRPPGADRVEPTAGDLAIPALDDQGDVLIRGVLDELVRLEVFGSETREEVADRLLTDDLTITTAYDPSAQAMAEAAIAELHPEGDRPDEVALLTIDNRTGAIVAVASSSPTSVLIDGLRQPGSAFKPIVLATLFEQGYQPLDMVSADGPCQFADPDQEQLGAYTVGGAPRGIQSVRAVTLSSNNCAFARLGQAAGLDQVAAMAEDLGVTTLPDDAGQLLSLPLGVTVVNGAELAGAYATFGNGGVHRTPWLVAEVTDRDGTVLYRREGPATTGRQVLSEETAALVAAVLEENVLAGTGIRASLPDGRAVAGKTGTTSGFIDAWFVGFTPSYTTVAWLGDPESTIEPIQLPGWNSFGGGLPTAIWGRYNEQLHQGIAPESFPATPDPFDGGGRLLEAEFEVEFDG